MSQALQPIEVELTNPSQQLEVYNQKSLELMSEPEYVLSEAQKAAKALTEVISKKKKPVMFNGEQYLEFEDLQTLARFYGITAKVVSTGYVTFDEVRGFEAKACAFDVRSGKEMSCAEAMCLNDERNWSSKPLFQLKSMAQTRACAKALRNVLSWVVVLAGYKPTPAEEMQEVFQKSSVEMPKKKEAPASIPESKSPYWDSKWEGKHYIFAKLGSHFNKEFLIRAGMKVTKANPETYIAIYSEDIEEALAKKLEASDV